MNCGGRCCSSASIGTAPIHSIASSVPTAGAEADDSWTTAPSYRGLPRPGPGRPSPSADRPVLLVVGGRETSGGRSAGCGVTVQTCSAMGLSARRRPDAGQLLGGRQLAIIGSSSASSSRRWQRFVVRRSIIPVEAAAATLTAVTTAVRNRTARRVWQYVRSLCQSSASSVASPLRFAQAL